MSELLDKIRSRGFWQAIIRPSAFVEERLGNIASIGPLIDKTSVSLRGWNFPHVDHKTDVHLDIDWAGQEFQWNHFLEIWRMYQSGQFVHVSGMFEDWFDESGLHPAWQGWERG